MRETEFSFTPPAEVPPEKEAERSPAKGGRFLKRFGAALALAGTFIGGVEYGAKDRVAEAREEYLKKEKGLTDTEYKALVQLENCFRPPDGSSYAITLEGPEGRDIRQAFAIAETMEFETFDQDRVKMLLMELTKYPSEEIAKVALQSLLNRDKFLAGRRTREAVKKGAQVLIGHDQEVTDTLVSLIDQEYDLAIPDAQDASQTPGTVVDYRKKYSDGFGEVNRMALEALLKRGGHGERALEEYLKAKQVRVEHVRRILGGMGMK